MFAMDHVIPVAKGGYDVLENLVPSCRRCNGMKSHRTIEDFRIYLSGKRSLTETQKDFLKSIGYADIDDKLDSTARSFRFWFEKEGAR